MNNENKPKIKFRNFWIWFKDQIKRRRVFIESVFENI